MIVIALGANLPSRAGEPRDTLKAALTELSVRGVRIASVSSYYVTKAWPDPADPPFVNAVARIETKFSPAELMALLHRTETSFGRQRTKKNAPRTLDLDLIDYDGRVQEGPPVLPHPRLADRAFVLVPLADIAPDWRHPATGRPISELIAALPTEEREIETLKT
ncbi:MAG: 2-amino-4-hydroxy-6-hydroxymethyldihydropteridine diphosphokinase [Rhizomicrobium sp.]